MNRCVLVSCAAWVFTFHVVFSPSVAAEEVPFTTAVIDEMVTVASWGGAVFLLGG